MDLLDDLNADLVASAVGGFLEGRKPGVSATANLERDLKELEDKVHTLTDNRAALQEENEYLTARYRFLSKGDSLSDGADETAMPMELDKSMIRMDLASRKAKARQLVMDANPALCIDHKGRIIGIVNRGDEEALDLLDNLNADLVASAVKRFLEDRKAGGSLKRKFKKLQDKMEDYAKANAALQRKNDDLRMVCLSLYPGGSRSDGADETALAMKLDKSKISC